MQDGALNHALEAQSGLSIHLAAYLGSVLCNEITQQLAQFFNVDRACPQYFGSRGVVEQRQQQVFHSDKLVALLARFHERHVKTNLEFLSNHSDFLNLMFVPSRTVAGAGAAWQSILPVLLWLLRRPWGRRRILPCLPYVL